MIQNKSSNNSSTQTETPKTQSTMGQAVAGAAGGAAAVFSFWNLSSPQGLWITMNQFQLILLLLLTKSNIPKSIVDYLSGLKATTWSFNFIPFKDIPGLNALLNYLDFQLPDKELESFGIFSGSTLPNNFSLVWIMLIFAWFHGGFLMISRLIRDKLNKTKKCRRWLEKTYQFFAFSLYLRILLEANQFLLISSLSELHEWKASNQSKIISLIFAFIGAFVCLWFIWLSVVNWVRHRNTESMDNYIPWKELFSGIKSTSWSKLYSTFLLTRRCLFVVILIFGKSLSNFELICPMIVVQVFYLGNLIIVRPYKQVKNNIIEITNESFYFLLVVLLSYFNTAARWAGVMENIYLAIILANSMTIISIMIGNTRLNHVCFPYETIL